jgi:hypothetical protein
LSAIIRLILAALIAIAAVEATSLGGQFVLRRDQRFDDEIRWLERLEPYRVWDVGRHAHIDLRYREQVERELRAGRLDHAVGLVRRARARVRAQDRRLPPALLEIGLETYARAADRLERGGRLAAAADWNDTLFAFAVRNPELRYRAAATAAFVEGLDQRVRAGMPCAALARIEWAKRGLGGEIPGFDPATEETIRMRCEQSRRGGRTR